MRPSTKYANYDLSGDQSELGRLYHYISTLQKKIQSENREPDKEEHRRIRLRSKRIEEIERDIIYE